MTIKQENFEHIKTEVLLNALVQSHYRRSKDLWNKSYFRRQNVKSRPAIGRTTSVQHLSKISSGTCGSISLAVANRHLPTCFSVKERIIDSQQRSKLSLLSL
jgi:hypothetical protein